ncbi:putative nuclease HARBI1 [Chionoecetes opilio]|uniref:Putative nuclease HARBI1 n=1 Tax=Chionoecetes opilio TaxID=41210 RepID=A0A8J5CPD9_CHIOP|nr:putative nuclease HARBI1 [Chionoecetes opilio]
MCSMAALHAFREVMDLREVMQVLQRNGRQRRTFCQRLDPMTYYSDVEFLARFRLSKESFDTLLTEIRHLLPSSRDRRGLRISPSLQLLVALRNLATGNFQLTLADTADLSQPSVSRCLKTVVHAIAEVAPRYIRFPTPAEEAGVMQAFSTIAGMPGYIGCLDGTLIPVRGPGGEEAELYRGRKGFYAYNVMDVCDASLCVINLVMHWPGSAHDSRVFIESQLCRTLQGGQYRGFLLGDSGYANRTYLLTPFPNPRAPHEGRFNASQVRTRNCVERVFGILKRRFAVLATPIRTTVASRSDIIVATFVLHNIAVINNLSLEEGPDPRVEDDDNIPEPDDQNNMPAAAAGRGRRVQIARRFF